MICYDYGKHENVKIKGRITDIMPEIGLIEIDSEVCYPIRDIVKLLYNNF